MKKLHLGCGYHFLDGWINTDINHKIQQFHPMLKYLDVTKTFPYQNREIDYIFTEHLIEHINFTSGRNMLRECYRVLKVGGKIRICTPDLAFLIDLYREDKSQLQLDYINDTYNSSDELKENNKIVSTKSDTFIINNFVRAWNHEFIYDKKTLSLLMSIVGFKNIKTYDLLKSDDSELKNLENVDRMKSGFLELESFVLEGTK